jgi:ribosome-binding factor A
MIVENKKKHIKKMQREAEIFKHIVIIMARIFKEKDILNIIYCNRVEISSDGSHAMVFIHSHEDKNVVLEIIKKIDSYKKQMYHQLCQSLSYRFVPKLFFVYDDQQVKVDKINRIIDSLKEDTHE